VDDSVLCRAEAAYARLVKLERRGADLIGHQQRAHRTLNAHGRLAVAALAVTGRVAVVGQNAVDQAASGRCRTAGSAGVHASARPKAEKIRHALWKVVSAVLTVRMELTADDSFAAMRVSTGSESQSRR
jgi:hypothetical protein